MKEKFAKQVERASKHLEVAPIVTFSEPMMKKETTIMNFGQDGCHKNVRMVEVIEVDIEQITSGDWKLVADVLYHEGILGMVDAGLYKAIPKNLGLEYDRCDYCGHRHGNRKEASIVYNTKTREWMQIGTACGKKMFRCGDICKFFVDLYKIIDMCGGCSMEGFGGWCAKLPDTAWKQAFSIDSLIPAVVNYRKEFGVNWEKPVYEECGRKLEKVKEGTTELFKEKFVEGALNGEANMEYGKKVKAFVEALPYDMDLDGVNEEGFNTKIKRAFENEYIQLFEIYTVFFAVQNYEDSLTAGDWDKVASRFHVDQYADINGAKVLSNEHYEDMYGGGWLFKFDCGGVIFSKTFSTLAAADKFKGEDDTYSFSAKVYYINNRKREIKLGGRARKIS